MSNEATKKSKNWRNRSPAELKRMCPQQKARYLAYEDPQKEVQKAVAATRQRACAHRSEGRIHQQSANPAERVEKTRLDALIGQLKAAEARNRIRLTRLRYQNLRAQEINLLVACQSTAQKAVRLELLLPIKESKFSVQDTLDKLERKRVEEILEDEQRLTITRS